VKDSAILDARPREICGWGHREQRADYPLQGEENIEGELFQFGL
jgi:hypothetical protein